jgi:hypothetical protein
VERALRGVLACLGDGLDVRGYFWSLLDGFVGVRTSPGVRTGLRHRTTQARTVKPSALAGRCASQPAARATA